MRICLAASGGGHVRQLLDLEPVWSRYDAFFVTEPTALGESLSAKYRTHFIPHVAMGQARLGKPLTMVKAAFRNLWKSWRIIRAERPDVVISTGAGAVFFTLLAARLHGAKVVAIESFARFDHPSLFMRLAAPLAHERVVQSKMLANRWAGARLFDPLVRVEGPRPQKDPLVFVTVGATLPFDRMVESVETLKRSGEIQEEIIAQVGIGGVRPEGMQVHETLPLDEVKSILKRADIVVCHGGTGSLITALREQCRVIAMPRLFALQEHYDDHQAEITQAFRQRGLIATANSVEELRSALLGIRSTEPVGASTEPRALIDWLNQTLDGWEQSPHRKRRRHS